MLATDVKLVVSKGADNAGMIGAALAARNNLRLTVPNTEQNLKSNENSGYEKKTCPFMLSQRVIYLAAPVLLPIAISYLLNYIRRK